MLFAAFAAMGARKVLKGVGAGEKLRRTDTTLAHSGRYQEANRAEEAPLPQGLLEVRLKERSGRHPMQEVPRL
jgi:hypothetical protein